MGARKGNALSRSGRFTRIGRGSNSSSTSRPDKGRGGGGFDIPRPQPVPPTPGQKDPGIRYRQPVPAPERRGPITRQPVPAPPRSEERVGGVGVMGRPDSEINAGRDNRLPSQSMDAQVREVNNTSREFGNIRTPSQSMDAQTKLLQTENTQYAKNKEVAAQLEAAQQQLGNRVGGVGVMGRPDSEINADGRLTTERIRTIQSDLADIKQKSVTQAKAKEMNRGIATRTTSFGRR